MTIRLSPYIQIQEAEEYTFKDMNYFSKVKAKMNETGDHTGPHHARWRDISSSYLNKGSFAVVRNPWDRVVSRFLFAKKVIEVERKQQNSYADVRSLDHFLEERHKWGNEEYFWHRAVRGWYNQLEYVINDKREIQSDIIRFENLNEDLCAYFNLKQMSGARNVTNLLKGSYTELYNPTTIQIVADWYKDDIETFGYDFDTGPNKNYWRLQS
jgi:hypothetical protein